MAFGRMVLDTGYAAPVSKASKKQPKRPPGGGGGGNPQRMRLDTGYHAPVARTGTTQSSVPTQSSTQSYTPSPPPTPQRAPVRQPAAPPAPVQQGPTPEQVLAQQRAANGGITDAQQAYRDRVQSIRESLAQMRAQQAMEAQQREEQQRQAEAAAQKQAEAEAEARAREQADLAARTVTIPDAKADAEFQRTRADLIRQLSGFKNQQQLGLDQYRGGYRDSLNQMGWEGSPQEGGFDQNDLTGSYGLAYRDNANDFAGRGLADSGLRVQALSMLNDQYNQRKSTLDRGLNDYQDTQQMALQNYVDQNKSARQNALAQAVARIAAQYGVGTNQVPTGAGPKTFVRPKEA